MAHYMSQPRIEGPIWLEPTDISFLQTRIAETETGVETLEEQISELTYEYETEMSRLKLQYDPQLSELVRIKEAKLVEISSLRNILSPIRRIPVEILSEILELSCIPAGGVFTSDYDAFLCASLVSSVCVAWRKAALADPQMWSTICVSLNRRRKGNIFMWLKEWIFRSQSHSLDLYLDLSFYDKDIAEQILECILDFCHQIRSIQIRLSTIPLPLFRLPRSSLPLLEKVLFDVYIQDLEYETEKLEDLLPHGVVEAFLGAPKLQHVGIDEHGAEDTSILDLLVLPHEQLASLEIHLEDALPGAIHRHTLCQCKNLVSFTTDFEPTFGLDFSICLPALKTLDITCWEVVDTTCTVNLLHGLTTPLLEHLTIRWRDQDIQALCTDLLGFQSRSSATLSSLRLIMDNDNYNNTPAEDFVDSFTLILAAFPTVRSLWLRVDHLNRRPLNAFIRSMIYTRDRRSVLPNLTYFEFSIYATSKYPPDMAPMLSSRRCPYKLDVEAVDDTDRVPQLEVVSRYHWDRKPTQYTDIMESQCILP